MRSSSLASNLIQGIAEINYMSFGHPIGLPLTQPLSNHRLYTTHQSTQNLKKQQATTMMAKGIIETALGQESTQNKINRVINE